MSRKRQQDEPPINDLDRDVCDGTMKGIAIFHAFIAIDQLITTHNTVNVGKSHRRLEGETATLPAPTREFTSPRPFVSRYVALYKYK